FPSPNLAVRPWIVKPTELASLQRHHMRARVLSQEHRDGIGQIVRGDETRTVVLWSEGHGGDGKWRRAGTIAAWRLPESAVSIAEEDHDTVAHFPPVGHYQIQEAVLIKVGSRDGGGGIAVFIDAFLEKAAVPASHQDEQLVVPEGHGEVRLPVPVKVTHGETDGRFDRRVAVSLCELARTVSQENGHAVIPGGCDGQIELAVPIEVIENHGAGLLRDSQG